MSVIKIAPKIMIDPQGFFKKGEREKIYDKCNTLRDRLLIRLLWKTGRRVTEIIKLQLKHIDFENNMILWNIVKKRDKNYKKWKPLDTFTIELLKDYIKIENLNSESYIFFSPKGNNYHISRQRVDQIIKKLCSKCGIYFVGNKKPHAHHFRHSFAIDISRKLKSPADIRKLQLLLEHSSLQMTECYLQFGDLELRDLIEED